MPSASTVQKIKDISGAKDLGSLTPEETTRLLKLLGEKRLSAKEAAKLLEVNPHFGKLATESLRSLASIAESASPVQREAIASLRACVEGLNTAFALLAERAESDQTREKLAEHLIEACKLHLEIAKSVERLNSDNNQVWKQLAVGALAVLGAVLSSAAVVYAAKSSGGRDA
jgi:predicted phage tail protein